MSLLTTRLRWHDDLGPRGLRMPLLPSDVRRVDCLEQWHLCMWMRCLGLWPWLFLVFDWLWMRLPRPRRMPANWTMGLNVLLMPLPSLSIRLQCSFRRFLWSRESTILEWGCLRLQMCPIWLCRGRTIRKWSNCCRCPLEIWWPGLHVRSNVHKLPARFLLGWDYRIMLLLTKDLPHQLPLGRKQMCLPMRSRGVRCWYLLGGIMVPMQKRTTRLRSYNWVLWWLETQLYLLARFSPTRQYLPLGRNWLHLVSYPPKMPSRLILRQWKPSLPLRWTTLRCWLLLRCWHRHLRLQMPHKPLPTKLLLEWPNLPLPMRFNVSCRMRSQLSLRPWYLRMCLFCRRNLFWYWLNVWLGNLRMCLLRRRSLRRRRQNLKPLKLRMWMQTWIPLRSLRGVSIWIGLELRHLWVGMRPIGMPQRRILLGHWRMWMQMPWPSLPRTLQLDPCWMQLRMRSNWCWWLWFISNLGWQLLLLPWLRWNSLLRRPILQPSCMQMPMHSSLLRWRRRLVPNWRWLRMLQKMKAQILVMFAS